MIGATMMSGFDDTYLDGLVERLRSVRYECSYEVHDLDALEAAEAITHLRSENSRLKQRLEMPEAPFEAYDGSSGR